MKRSEILKKMVDCYTASVYELGYTRTKAFDRVLEIIEEEGMLPPARFDTMIDAYINKWEPEED